jgi:hypothetical protein
MTEILVKFDEAITDSTGAKYFAHAVGRKRDEDGLWEGCLEFLPVDTNRVTVSSGRETTQPSRKTLEYWAQGLTRVYLMGALDRAQRATPSIAREREAFAPHRRSTP